MATRRRTTTKATEDEERGAEADAPEPRRRTRRSPSAVDEDDERRRAEARAVAEASSDRPCRATRTPRPKTRSPRQLGTERYVLRGVLRGGHARRVRRSARSSTASGRPLRQGLVQPDAASLAASPTTTRLRSHGHRRRSSAWSSCSALPQARRRAPGANEVAAELAKVTWPTRKEVTNSTRRRDRRRRTVATVYLALARSASGRSSPTSSTAMRADGRRASPRRKRDVAMAKKWYVVHDLLGIREQGARRAPAAHQAASASRTGSARS